MTKRQQVVAALGFFTVACVAITCFALLTQKPTERQFIEYARRKAASSADFSKKMQDSFPQDIKDRANGRRTPNP